ncbi:MAG: molybdopterin-dependent oxidoreductase [Polyangiaceae bacterium]
MSDDQRAAKEQRIVESRMRLMERFRERMARTPGMSDGRPQGEGPANRHGMPRLPVGQVETHKWPVLDLGFLPNVELGKWRLTVDGACDHPLELDFEALNALPVITDASDFHCVTTWSRFDLKWRGVRVSDVLAAALPLATASHLMCHGYDGYSTNVPLEEALKPDVLIAFGVNGKPLPAEHGGPVRMITPQLYAWKGSKWIRRLELMVGDRPGYWEQRGYSMSAHPWHNDRYG